MSAAKDKAVLRQAVRADLVEVIIMVLFYGSVSLNVEL
jgi:hypothetical protein